MEKVIECKKLKKKYGKVKAVNGIDFFVNKGEVYGFLGPNGAGKTTTLEIFEGLRKADSGCVEILGMDAFKEGKKIKQRIGVQLQSTAIDKKMKIREALMLFAGFYDKQVDYDWLIDLVSLREKENELYDSLSGGQKQRLAVALALVNDPDLIFLDEPTTGLDPQARRKLWDVIVQMKEKGKTIILTTHYMDEAQQLCDRVAIIDNGVIIAEDTPQNLIDSMKLNSSIHFRASEQIKLDDLKKLKAIQNVFMKNDRYYLHSKELQKSITDLIAYADKKNIELSELSILKANLEDFFIEKTGRSLRD